MTFDEFLLSDDTNYKFQNSNEREKNIIKIKYNNNIDFIYIPSYGDFEYGSKLEFIGMFEKNTRKLYGNSFYLQGTYYQNIYSSLFECSISEIYDKIIKETNILLDSYIEKNRTKLMKLSQNLFDKFISFDENYKEIKRGAIEDYIYNKESNITFSVDSYKHEYETKDIIMQYIQNPLETVKRVYNEYVNNTEKEESLRWYENNNPYYKVTVKEYIGVRLHQQEFYEKLRKELKKDSNNEYRKKHEIMQSIKNLDAKFITITVKHNDKFCTFKYPQNLLYNMDFYEWHIPDLKIREQMENLYKDISWNKDEIFMKEIVKIEYSRKVLYEDSKLLNKENNIQETHDIVDEMFD